MDGKWFSQAYENPPMGRRYLEAEQRELLQPIFDWADSFSLALHHFLQGGEFSNDEAGAFLGEYNRYLENDFPQLADQVMAAGPNAAQGLINFHKLNADFLPVWWHVMQGHESIPEGTARGVQNTLAARGVLMMPAREEAIKRGIYFGDEYEAIRGSYNGFLNEIDTGITALEISIEHPNIVVVPSPSQFLMSPDSGRNTNYVAVNLENRHAHGIQTRMSVSKADMEETDRDYVTNIDGKVDLGSTKVARTNTQSAAMVAWPGLIAAHHLKNTQGSTAVDRNTKTAMERGLDRVRKQKLKTNFLGAALRIERSKSLAEKHAGSSTSMNDIAAKIVVNRVMSELE